MLLATYLNDHLAGATAGRELARRAAANNRGSELGRFLEDLAQEIDQDRDSLIELMDGAGVGIDRVKVLGGWTAEKLGRLKLNGKLLGYSPLSRLLELEGLLLGVRGKLALWQALGELELESGAWAGANADLGELIARAERQHESIEQHRRAIAADTLAG
jgi:hypothetical protein